MAFYGNGQNATLHTPYLNGDQVILFGASAATEPVITIADGTVNTWDSILSAGYGEVILWPSQNNSLVLTHGVDLAGGHLTMGTIDGGSVTLNGVSSVRNGSVLTELGGRYQADPTILNGSIYVSSRSFADFTHTPLRGAGTVHVQSSAIVEVNAVVAGLNLYVDKGAELVFAHSGPAKKMLGTIHAAAGGDTWVGSVATAAAEIFHRSTGELDIVDRWGTDLVSLKFSGASSLYATPAFGGVDITTTRQAHSLPTLFVH
jgi:hypothetical protein